MTNSYSVLNTIAVGGADITLAGRDLNVAITASTGSGTFPTIDYINIEKEVSVAAAAEVLRIQTVSYSVANSTTYKLGITQLVGGTLKQAFITYVSDANATDAEIAAALVGQINAHTELGITASGAATPITLTAKTGSPIFDLQGISNLVPATASPAGTVAQGQGADLVAAGIVGAVAGNAYKQYVFTYGTKAGVQMGNATVNGGNVHTLYVDEGHMNFSAFDTRMDRVLAATDFATGAVANPEAVSVE